MMLVRAATLVTVNTGRNVKKRVECHTRFSDRVVPPRFGFLAGLTRARF